MSAISSPTSSPLKQSNPSEQQPIVRPIRDLSRFDYLLIARITLAALGSLVVYKGGSALVLGALGLMVSPGAVILAAGSYFFCVGVSAVITSIGTGSLATLACGILGIGIGASAAVEGLFVPSFLV